MRTYRLTALALVLALGCGVAAAQAARRIFSYDPANASTRSIAGPLTFEFNQRLIFVTVLKIRSTEGRATADLKPVDEGVLGRGGLSALIGAQAPERDLYEVEPSDEGMDLTHAFCPGSHHAWLAFGRLVAGRDLRIRVLGDDPGDAGKARHARLCQTFDFAYRGEWRLPPGSGVPMRDLPMPKFPY
jgi:hypothetical protein